MHREAEFRKMLCIVSRAQFHVGEQRAIAAEAADLAKLFDGVHQLSNWLSIAARMAPFEDRHRYNRVGRRAPRAPMPS
jgi:hypothetical protein